MRVYIERLIFEGIAIAPHQRLLLQAAVKDELTRLVVADGIPSALTPGRYPSLPASTIRFTNTNDPEQMGRQIAQSVYGGIK